MTIVAEQLFKIVVADDEDELREAMCRLIDWQEVGFELVGSAGNGLDALQLVEQLQPDLLLTDIQMPFISGTALAAQVRQVQPLIQVVFLSGYDDFEYARSAIDNRVLSYLLKPISMADLTEALRDIHRKMEEQYGAYIPRGEQHDLSLALAGLLLDPESDRLTSAQWLEVLGRCGLQIPPDNWLAVATLAPETPGLLPQNTAQMTDRALAGRLGANSIVCGDRILSLLRSGTGYEELGNALDEYYYVAKRILDCDCRIGVSRIFTDLAQASTACRESAEAVRLSEGTGVCRIDGVQTAKGGMELLVRRTLEIIDSRYTDEALSLGSVSEELHVSPNYLSANMKKYAGDTFINLLIKRRMEAAKALVMMRQIKVGEIAERCGYTDQHYFSYCFKKYYGVSPVKMRRGEEA